MRNRPHVEHELDLALALKEEVATGVVRLTLRRPGITPLLPMIASVADSGAAWSLVYGGRSLSSMAFGKQLKHRYAGRATLTPQDESGLLDLAAILSEPGVTATDLAVYCCGPEALIAAVEDRCASWPEGALHVERFSPKESVPAVQRSFEVEFARSGLTMTVPSERSILEVAEEAGVEVPHSCRDGVCGTCETPVLSGEPDHRDSILTKEEQAACDTMMICCSRCSGPRLVLDL